jgi:hypothetical protein
LEEVDPNTQNTVSSFLLSSFSTHNESFIGLVHVPVSKAVPKFYSQTLEAVWRRWTQTPNESLIGLVFYAGGQVLLFAFSVTICDAVRHYVNGLFFFMLCVLLKQWALF